MVNSLTNYENGERHMKDTRNFTSKEFQCPDCGLNNMSQTMINTLQKIRDRLGVPMHINSGSRCATRNKLDGGKPNSAHCKGFAVDIAVPKAASGLRYSIIAYALQEGIKRVGIGDNFIHLDIDPILPQNQIWIY
jgi:zinc D-Ala-D-Ala carboxypeptidase